MNLEQLGVVSTLKNLASSFPKPKTPQQTLENPKENSKKTNYDSNKLTQSLKANALFKRKNNPQRKTHQCNFESTKAILEQIEKSAASDKEKLEALNNEIFSFYSNEHNLSSDEKADLILGVCSKMEDFHLGDSEYKYAHQVLINNIRDMFDIRILSQEPFSKDIEVSFVKDFKEVTGTSLFNLLSSDVGALFDVSYNVFDEAVNGVNYKKGENAFIDSKAKNITNQNLFIDMLNSKTLQASDKAHILASMGGLNIAARGNDLYYNYKEGAGNYMQLAFDIINKESAGNNKTANT